MRFADQIVSARDLDIPALSREPTERELEMAQRLVETLAQSWEPGQYEDRHRQAVMSLIEQKAAGQELPVPEVHEPQETPDLIAALEASLAGRPRGRKPTAAGGRRRAPATPRTGTGGSRGSRSRSR
jgi:DNA end-binding protein Ku